MKGDIISDGEFLYKYASPKSFPEDQKEVPFGIFVGIFEMSCDWERYQRMPERSFHIAEGKTIIIKISVCDAIKNPVNPRQTKHIMTEWKQEVFHDPVGKNEDARHPEGNISHSLIRGQKRQPVASIIAQNSTLYKRVNISDFLSTEKKIDEKIPFLSIIIVALLVLLFMLFFSI
jgi:hypothetical protein